MQFICHHCNGYGNSFKEQDDNCPYCHGKGTLSSETTPCLCDGTNPNCPDCEGNGVFRNEMAETIFGEELPDISEKTYGSTEKNWDDEMPAFLGSPHDEDEDIVGPEGSFMPPLPGSDYNLPR